MCGERNSLSVSRHNKHVFPTPESPKRRSLKRTSYCFAMAWSKFLTKCSSIFKKKKSQVSYSDIFPVIKRSLTPTNIREEGKAPLLFSLVFSPQPQSSHEPSALVSSILSYFYSYHHLLSFLFHGQTHVIILLHPDKAVNLVKQPSV